MKRNPTTPILIAYGTLRDRTGLNSLRYSRLPRGAATPTGECSAFNAGIVGLFRSERLRQRGSTQPTKGNPTFGNCSLMAEGNGTDDSLTVSQQKWSNFNSPIFQNSIPEQSCIGSISSVSQSFIVLTPHRGQTQERPLEIGFSQVGEIESNRATLTQRLTEISSGQISIAKVNPTQIATIPTSLYQISSPQIGVAKITSVESHVISGNSNQGSITEISSFNIISLSKVTPIQIDSTQISSIPQSGITTDVIKDQTWEVSSTSSIEFQKLFNSINPSSGVKTHDLTPNLLTNIYSTAQTLWHSNTSIDLNFAITNLPTGQLAEVGLPPVGWVEPRWRSLSERNNPTTPPLKARSIEIIGHLFTVPILTILNIQSPSIPELIDIGDVGFHSLT